MADYIQYDNQGAVRNKPLAPELVDALGFLPELGITARVFSGGQPVQGSNQPRVGSTRHDEGNAADLFFYKDGRRLDWSNPDDLPIFQQIVSSGRERGLTGFGAGPNYMQPGSMHVGFGTPTIWGEGGRSANAPEWLRQAYYGQGSGGMASTERDTNMAETTRGGGLFGGLFGGQQEPQAQNTTSTDPFENLSRSQRTMLGFAALRDAAASLEGRDSQYFQGALGGFEQGRERERLRAQGIQQNQVGALQALAQVEQQIALSQAYGVAPSPAALQMRDMLMQNVGGMGGAASTQAPVMPAQAPVTGVAPPAPITQTPLPQQGGFDPTQVQIGAPTESPAAPVDPMAALDAREAELLQRANAITAAGGDTGPIQMEMRQLENQRERLASEAATAAEAQAASEAEAARLAANAPQTVNTLQTVQDLRSSIEESPRLTTGFWGNVLGNVPGSSAYDARALGETIRANLGFDRLQAMREASPTGGALGSVAVQELNALQSTVANLDLAQSEDQVLRNLQAIEDNYKRIIERAYATTEDPAALDDALGGRPSFLQEGNEATTDAPRRMRYNPETGAFE